MVKINFGELENSDLVVDAIYEGGNVGNLHDEVLSKLLKVGNSGGIRVCLKRGKIRKPAYIVLFSTTKETAWPDELDESTGILRYYGDNREPGKLLHDTPRKGNSYFRDIFRDAENKETRKNVPPIFIFMRTGNGRDIQFKGVAVPGRIGSQLTQDLFAVWRSKNGQRFQNYEAYFTVLDINIVKRDWLTSLLEDVSDDFQYAPIEWKRYIKSGIKAIKPLQTVNIDVPSKYEQLPHSKNDLDILQTIIDAFPKNKACDFEKCAISIAQMFDKNFLGSFRQTRPSRDGGRDAIGKYRIGTKNTSISLECALEAKCYSLTTSVGVRDTSRLISRIRNKQFGIFVTTSYIAKQAYREIIEDQHPILIITGRDIVEILKSTGISTVSAIKEWICSTVSRNS